MALSSLIDNIDSLIQYIISLILCYLQEGKAKLSMTAVQQHGDVHIVHGYDVWDMAGFVLFARGRHELLRYDKS